MGVMNTDGTNRIRLLDTEDAYVYVHHPAWSPDSRKIAYIRHKDDYTFSLCIMNPDGTGKTEITEGRIDWESMPVWSPDGKKIAFSMDEPSNVYIVNVDGSGLTKLAEGRYPQWSPV